MSVGGSAASLLTGTVNANTSAPTIDQSGVNTDLNQLQGTEAEQGQTLGLENQIAQGKGPSAATSLLENQTATAQAGAGALASSNSGANGAGAAKRDAIMAGANATQQMGGQAAAARAGEQLGAIQGAAGIESGVAGEQLGAGGLQGGLATSQAQIAQQNQQIQQQAQESNVKGAGNALSAVGGAVSGALKFLDADFVEPAPPGSKDKNGAPPAHFTFREERGGPNHLPFMALIDRTTGRARKIATEELTPSEHHQLYAPHAAGPLDSPQRKTAEMHDMSMGGGSGGASPGFGLGGGQSMDVGGALKEFSGDATSNLTQGGRAGAAGPGGPQYADGDMTQDPRFVEMVRRAHPALYRAATSTKYADGDAMEVIGRTAPGDVPTDENTLGYVPPSAPSGYGADLAAKPSGDKAKRSKDFQSEVDTARVAEDPDRAAFMEHEGEGHFMPPSKDAEDVKRAYEAHTAARGNMKDVIGGALSGFSNGITGGKAQSYQPAGAPRTPGVKTPGVAPVGAAPDVQSTPMGTTPTYSDGEMDGGYEPEPRPVYAAADPPGVVPGTRDWIPSVSDDEYGNRSVGATNGGEYKTPLAKTMAKKKGGGDPMADDMGRFPEEREAIDRINRESDSLMTGDGEDRHPMSAEERDRHDAEADALLRQAPQHLTRAGNKARRKQNHPGTYMDGEMGGRTGVGSKEDPLDLDSWEPGTQENPVDLDEDTPENQQGAREARSSFTGRVPKAHTEYEPIPHDPALDWGKGPDPKHDAFVRAQAAEMVKLNPYLEVKPKPALAMMFPAKKGPKVGPTDWMAALHESNERYNRRPLGASLDEESADSAENARHESALNTSLGAADDSGLVPGEAEGIDINEARRRVKSRKAVHNLLEQWKAERSTRHASVPEKRYADGEMTAPAAQKRSALASTMKRKTMVA